MRINLKKPLDYGDNYLIKKPLLRVYMSPKFNCYKITSTIYKDNAYLNTLFPLFYFPPIIFN